MSSPIYPKQPGFFEPLAQLHSTTWPLRQSATNCWITVCSWAAVHALMVTPCYTISSTKLACASSFCLIFLSPWSSSTKSVWKIVLKNWTCLSHCFFLWKKKSAHGWDWLFILVYSYNIHPYFKPKAPMKQTKSRSLPLHTLPRQPTLVKHRNRRMFFCLENAGAVTFSRSILPMAHSWVEQQLYTYIISIYLYENIYVKWNI